MFSLACSSGEPNPNTRKGEREKKHSQEDRLDERTRQKRIGNIIRIKGQREKKKFTLELHSIPFMFKNHTKHQKSRRRNGERKKRKQQRERKCKKNVVSL